MGVKDVKEMLGEKREHKNDEVIESESLQPSEEVINDILHRLTTFQNNKNKKDGTRLLKKPSFWWWKQRKRGQIWALPIIYFKFLPPRQQNWTLGGLRRERRL
jgi:hypothetical protein